VNYLTIFSPFALRDNNIINTSYRDEKIILGCAFFQGVYNDKKGNYTIAAFMENTGSGDDVELRMVSSGSVIPDNVAKDLGTCDADRMFARGVAAIEGLDASGYVETYVGAVYYPNDGTTKIYVGKYSYVALAYTFADEADVELNDDDIEAYNLRVLASPDSLTRTETFYITSEDDADDYVLYYLDDSWTLVGCTIDTGNIGRCFDVVVHDGAIYATTDNALYSCDLSDDLTNDANWTNVYSTDTIYSISASSDAEVMVGVIYHSLTNTAMAYSEDDGSTWIETDHLLPDHIVPVGFPSSFVPIFTIVEHENVFLLAHSWGDTDGSGVGYMATVASFNHGKSWYERRWYVNPLNDDDTWTQWNNVYPCIVNNRILLYTRELAYAELLPQARFTEGVGNLIPRGQASVFQPMFNRKLVGSPVFVLSKDSELIFTAILESINYRDNGTQDFTLMTIASELRRFYSDSSFSTNTIAQLIDELVDESNTCTTLSTQDSGSATTYNLVLSGGTSTLYNILLLALMDTIDDMPRLVYFDDHGDRFGIGIIEIEDFSTHSLGDASSHADWVGGTSGVFRITEDSTFGKKLLEIMLEHDEGETDSTTFTLPKTSTSTITVLFKPLDLGKFTDDMITFVIQDGSNDLFSFELARDAIVGGLLDETLATGTTHDNLYVLHVTVDYDDDVVTSIVLNDQEVTTGIMEHFPFERYSDGYDITTEAEWSENSGDADHYAELVDVGNELHLEIVDKAIGGNTVEYEFPTASDNPVTDEWVEIETYMAHAPTSLNAWQFFDLGDATTFNRVKIRINYDSGWKLQTSESGVYATVYEFEDDADFETEHVLRVQLDGTDDHKIYWDGTLLDTYENDSTFTGALTRWSVLCGNAQDDQYQRITYIKTSWGYTPLYNASAGATKLQLNTYRDTDDGDLSPTVGESYVMAKIFGILGSEDAGSDPAVLLTDRDIISIDVVERQDDIATSSRVVGNVALTAESKSNTSSNTGEFGYADYQRWFGNMEITEDDWQTNLLANLQQPYRRNRYRVLLLMEDYTMGSWSDFDIGKPVIIASRQRDTCEIMHVLQKTYLGSGRVEIELGHPKLAILDNVQALLAGAQSILSYYAENG
jgi:hypothetical protein